MGIGVGFDPFWWEGTPSSNINITNNTVVDCPYDPAIIQPAINVYAGSDNLNATTPLQTNIVIAGNLVIGGAVRLLHVWRLFCDLQPAVGAWCSESA